MATVMLVDDSRTILLSLSTVLTKAGHQVVTASDGAQALAAIAGSRPQVVITDLNMPGMDGIAFVAEARKRPETRFVPILMLTTESDTAKREAAKAAGATGWLVKPVQAEQLLDVIARVLPKG